MVSACGDLPLTNANAYEGVPYASWAMTPVCAVPISLFNARAPTTPSAYSIGQRPPVPDSEALRQAAAHGPGAARRAAR